MSPKTTLYISLFVLALLLLAVGGWVAKGVQAFGDRTELPPPRPRFA
jgi:hypothetical protein